MPAGDVIAQDIAGLLRATPPAAWERLRGQRIFVTGGTGFVGKWLLQALAGAQRELDLGMVITVLTRSRAAFARAEPQLAGSTMLRWVEGDVAGFEFPADALDLVIHAALPVQPGGDGSSLITTALEGTQHVCRFAAHARARRLLHVSSGAVYGAGGAAFDESTPFAGEPANSYTQAKRAAEQVVHGDWPFETIVARCFAFLGPWQQPSSGSAPAQFIAAAAAGQPVQVRGAGTAVRSYQYAADMARWLLVLLALAPAGTVCNVGSDEAVDILQLATKVSTLAGAPLQVLGRPDEGLAGNFYLPRTARAAQLGLANTTSLDEGLRRTLAWRRATLQPERTS